MGEKTAEQDGRMRDVTLEVEAERGRQHARFGEQNHPDGTGGLDAEKDAFLARETCAIAFEVGAGTWRHLLVEETTEVLAESDPEALRAELIQVAAVAVQWVEALDRRRIH